MPEDTPNHELNRPDRGAQNWHEPLNNNFEQIDSQVEVRDSEGNRGEYEPKDNAKFLATDTGRVYLGDGSQWVQLGVVQGTGGGGVIARPGQVQSLIDEYATGDQWGPQPMRKISLAPGEVYETSETWTLRPGTRLDCNGALVRPQGDFDVIELTRNTAVHSPRINVADVGEFTSAAIVISGTNGKIGTSNPATVHDCHLFNDDRTGVGLLFEGNSGAVSLQQANGNIRNFDRGLEFRAAGAGNGNGWCNGNEFKGVINGSRIPVYLRSLNGDAVSGNTVRAQLQCSSGSEWLIRQEDAEPNTFIRSNTYIIQPWDTSQITNPYKETSNREPPRAPIWYIGEGQQEYNTIWSLSGAQSNQFVLNRSTTGRERNGVFNAAGGDASRGAVDFSHPPTYVPNQAPFHPDS